jgi:hypothetical protein
VCLPHGSCVVFVGVSDGSLMLGWRPTWAAWSRNGRRRRRSGAGWSSSARWGIHGAAVCLPHGSCVVFVGICGGSMMLGWRPTWAAWSRSEGRKRRSGARRGSSVR